MPLIKSVPTATCTFGQGAQKSTIFTLQMGRPVHIWSRSHFSPLLRSATPRALSPSL